MKIVPVRKSDDTPFFGGEFVSANNRLGFKDSEKHITLRFSNNEDKIFDFENYYFVDEYAYQSLMKDLSAHYSSLEASLSVFKMYFLKKDMAESFSGNEKINEALSLIQQLDTKLRALIDSEISDSDLQRMNSLIKYSNICSVHDTINSIKTEHFFYEQRFSEHKEMDIRGNNYFYISELVKKCQQ